ncbi:MAG: FecR domain-containing protein [Bacteroidota bacterium]
MKEEQHLDKIAKYLSDNSESKEREDLFAWVKEHPKHKDLLEESMEIWEGAEAADLDFQPNIGVAWDKMEQRLQNARAQTDANLSVQPTATIRSIDRSGSWMRYAASLLAIAGISLWLYTNTDSELIKEQTFAQEKTIIDLPDGSKIWLNQNSTLQYEKHFDKRVVYLEGEAFFDVAKMRYKPFEIFAGDSKTKVLGTSFNVRAYPDEGQVEIAVETGKVDFSSEDMPKEKVLLTKGEYARYTKQSQKVEKLEYTKLNAAAWKKGTLFFKNSQLTDVVESLERYYDVEIEVDNERIYNCIWNNTQAYEKPALEDLLELIEFANDLEIERVGDQQFRFSGQGCD